MESLAELFDFSRFMPHGMCFLWRWDLLILHVGSDLLIALAYFSIPTALFTLMRRRPDLQDWPIFTLFASFIFLCGITHLASIVTVWYPAYIVEGLFKLATAGVSVATAIALWPLIPRALAMPSRADLEERNREIERLNRRLQHRIDSLTTLAGGVSHDFNNLLTVIRGNAQLLELDADQHGNNQSIDAILEASNRAADLCGQMLAYSGRGHFMLSPVNVSEVVKQASVSAPPGINITWSLGSGLPAVNAAPDQLKQLVGDLFTNAVEAVASQEVVGDVRISTRAADLDVADLAKAAFEHELQPGPAVMIEVADNGSGIPQAVVERVFEPYYSTKFTGRGLGMAAVQGIVRGHGGCLFVDTQAGAGTTVTVALPTNEPAAFDAAASAGERRKPGTKTMLVVEDEPQVLAITTRQLERLGMRVLASSTREGALQLARKHADELDVVLLDYLMPGITGVDLLGEIRDIVECEAWLMSGYTRGEIEEPSIRQLFTGFIKKPFTTADLEEAFGSAQQDPKQKGKGTA